MDDWLGDAEWYRWFLVASLVLAHSALMHLGL